MVTCTSECNVRRQETIRAFFHSLLTADVMLKKGCSSLCSLFCVINTLDAILTTTITTTAAQSKRPTASFFFYSGKSADISRGEVSLFLREMQTATNHTIPIPYTIQDNARAIRYYNITVRSTTSVGVATLGRLSDFREVPCRSGDDSVRVLDTTIWL